MKKIVLLSLATFLGLQLQAQLNVTYLSNYQYGEVLSNIWGYAAPDGTEYALVGTNSGVSIINLSDPANPVESDFVPSAISAWREIKTWGTHAYVTNETGQGLLVIDLSNLPGEVTFTHWAPTIPGLGTLSTIHSIWMDEYGVAYLNGSNLNGGGILFVDVATTPGTPVYIGKGAFTYAHDSYSRGNLAFSFEIQNGQFSVYDVTDKTNVILLASQPTPGLAAHNGWLSDDGNILFTTDETNYAPVTSYDISDLSNIIELDQFRPLATLGTGVIPHNVHTLQDWLIVSYYTDGVIVVDGSRPDNLIEVGNFDTYIPTSTGFAGAWGVYPYLPSGLILVSDIGNGLYVLQPNYVRAAWLEGKVTDAQSGIGLPGATIDILNDLAVGQSELDGTYGTGLAIAGTYEVTVSKAGYLPVTATVELINGEVTELNVALESLPTFALTGKVTDAATGDAVPDAQVQVLNNDFEYNVQTDAGGEFILPAFYAGSYQVLAGKWGYKTALLASQDFDALNNVTQIQIEKGIEDVFSLDLGWSVEGSAVQGHFELGDPIGIQPQPGIFVQPENDVPEDVGTSCYITGNVADLFAGVQGDGTTRLISPEFDLSGMVEPKVSYYTWLFTANVVNNPPTAGNEQLIVKLTNGTNTVILEKRSFTNLFSPAFWKPTEITVKDTLAPTATMRIIFEIGDADPNFTDVAEAGVDFFQAWDALPSGTNEPQPAGISMSVFPNPSSDAFFVRYQLLVGKAAATLSVFNLLGQLVETQDLTAAQGMVETGSGLEKGIYFVRIDGSPAVKVIKQ